MFFKYLKEKKKVIGQRVIEPKISIIGSYVSILITIIILITACIVLGNGIKFKNNGVEVTATVTSIIENESERSIYIEYEVEGTKYNNKLGYWDEGLDLHSSVDIICLKDDPMTISGKSNFILLAIMLFVIAIGIGLMAFFNLKKYYKEEYRIYKLLKDGIKKEGTVVCSEELNIYSNHTFNAWALTATIQDEVFNSSKYWVKQPLIDVRDAKIDIYIDRNDSNNYYIDLLSIRGGKLQGEDLYYEE